MGASKKTLEELKANMPKSAFHEKMAFHETNKHWLDKSFEISLTILEAIDEKGWNQTQLAEKLGVSRQRVSKMLKGQENFQLSTLVKLEEVLGVEFIQADGLNFKNKLNNYLTELNSQVVTAPKGQKRYKVDYKESMPLNIQFEGTISNTARDRSEKYSDYDLAA